MSDEISALPPVKQPDTELCPECNMPAKLIGRYEMEGHVSVATYECPNCHHFSKIVNLKQKALAKGNTAGSNSISTD